MNKTLLEYTGSLLLDGRYIVSPYGVSKEEPSGDIVPLGNPRIHNSALKPITINYSNIRELTVINGLGVTLGDSIVGITALHAIKKINPEIIINVVRPEHCPDYVNEIYYMAGPIIDKIQYMPYDISMTTESDVVIDMGNQVYWSDFDCCEMHDFFIKNLGIPPSSVSLDLKSNSWLRNSKYESFKKENYVLFCPNASTEIRSIPNKYHKKIVETLSQKFKSRVLGFHDVDHENYLNISNYSRNTACFAGIIKNASYLYTCDSSALHLGAGFRIPTTCIFTTIKPEYRSLYYKDCESIYVGNYETEGIHCSDDSKLIKSLDNEFEVLYE
ncbi:ADP-heptose:LPS heptosyltransferase [Serratia sp. JKS296]|uniref:glycosyltransferase family 9 protein n=1 Tax=Serratia sp. JKS296 TaxID=1938824 RepID=UPI000BD5B149|nr:hypothetical protein [Serratia sp. JKS296]SOD79950.1 ADP-heptose:LPS heptosyltransferase [Serratia sp. JKS296]